MTENNPMKPPVFEGPRSEFRAFSEDTDVREITAHVQQAGSWMQPLLQEVGRVIIGQRELLEKLMVGLLTNGHILLEGVPGLAKTLTFKTLATAIQADFKRIQFTPDLLPADVVGTEIYHPHDGTFRVKHGPVFANLILADEINRAPAKVQSALLEAMQERQVTIGEKTYRLPSPFLVVATQNPLEHEGTYTLPEAQLDRFMLKVIVSYPTLMEERQILDLMGKTEAALGVKPILALKDIAASRSAIDMIYMDDRIKQYIVSLVHATREPETYSIPVRPYIRHAASPRATIALALATRATAFIHGRGYVTPQDVKSMALDVLRHRVGITYEADAEGLKSEDVIRKILDTLPVP